MPWRMVSVAVVVLLLGADAPEDKAKQTTEKLQGTWVLTAKEINGQEEKLATQSVGDSRVLISGNQMITFAGTNKMEGVFRLPGKANRLDLVDRMGNVVQTLFTLEDDVLKICMTGTGERPASMYCKAGVVLTYKRDKQEDSDLAAFAAELKKLEGAWKMKLKKDSGDVDTEVMWVFKGDEMTCRIDGKDLADKATVVLNPKMQPQLFGLLFPGSSQVGYYSLEDDTLTISFTSFGGPQKMIVLKRVNP